MKRVVIFLCLSALCVFPSLSAEFSVSGLDQVMEQAEEYGVETQGDLEQGMGNLISDAARQIGQLLRASVATGLKLMAVVLMCGLAERATAQGSEVGLSAVTIAGALAITALTMTDMSVMIGLGRETLGKMEGFSSLLLPVMAVLTAATGGITAAAVRQGATVLFSQLLMTAMDRLLIPMVYAYVALSCAYAAVGNPGLQKLAGLIKSMATFLLTAMLLAFVGYLTASGAIAGSVDAAAIKAAKLTISRAIPVVGGILADASESVLAGAGMLRGSVGAVGLVTVLAICMTPFLCLAVQYFVFKVTGALSACVAQPRLSQLIDAIGGAFGLVLGMTGAGALILLVSLVSAITAVTG